ncbi:hypothetical protein [Enterococcus hirae]|uniref:hypothetical protein n=1 Tax=Enterococcus hirae TaxID=1354 RepID=UPI00136D1F7E|nr:hypothetical protein [Enterococcus hirae]NAE18054.1 hypothetical protein [Enterococcus hirae]
MAAPTRRADKPAPVAFNIDEWESENPSEPFPVVVGGRRYILEDPNYIDFRDLLVIQGMTANITRDEMERVMRLLVSEDEQEAFLKNRFPSKAFYELIRRWVAHFGVGDAGEADALPG